MIRFALWVFVFILNPNWFSDSDASVLANAEASSKKYLKAFNVEIK